MKAVILAGGKGTRLAPYTTVFPKPLMPVGDMPILEITIRQLKSHGITEIVLCVGHMASLMQAYFGNGERLGVSISYSFEDQPLGTAGPLSLVPGLDSTFIVTNGDLLTTIDYSKMVRFHRGHGGPGTIGLADKDVKIDLGVIKTGTNGAVTDYIEKPVINYKVSMGIYVFEPAALTHIPHNSRFDLPDLVKALMKAGTPPAGFDSKCRWLDIGRVDDYAVATETFERDRALYLPS